LVFHQALAARLDPDLYRWHWGGGGLHGGVLPIPLLFEEAKQRYFCARQHR